ncbi:MAG: hypothetical protein EB121_08050, partial [Alphaproteobacteria bacterium]|nr:hypothetical protein [Alphaproteobacteria bacterium]
EQPLVHTFSSIVDWFNGNLGKGLATVAVIVIGILALYGKVEWKMALLTGVGIAAMFGAAGIYQQFEDSIHPPPTPCPVHDQCWGGSEWVDLPVCGCQCPAGTTQRGDGACITCPDTSTCPCGTTYDDYCGSVCESDCNKTCAANCQHWEDGVGCTGGCPGSQSCNGNGGCQGDVCPDSCTIWDGDSNKCVPKCPESDGLTCSSYGSCVSICADNLNCDTKWTGHECVSECLGDEICDHPSGDNSPGVCKAPDCTALDNCMEFDNATKRCRTTCIGEQVCGGSPGTKSCQEPDCESRGNCQQVDPSSHTCVNKCGMYQSCNNNECGPSCVNPDTSNGVCVGAGGTWDCNTGQCICPSGSNWNGSYCFCSEPSSGWCGLGGWDSASCQCNGAGNCWDSLCTGYYDTTRCLCL